MWVQYRRPNRFTGHSHSRHPGCNLFPLEPTVEQYSSLVCSHQRLGLNKYMYSPVDLD
jgi:hypothetical protein